MLRSMTGFGRAENNLGNRQVTVEIKSLNGKQFELVSKIAPILRSYELDIRTMLSGMLFRGTIDLTVSVRQDGASKPMSINTTLARYYYESMQQITRDLSIPADNILATLMRMPEVVAADADVLPEADWAGIRSTLEQAAANLMNHREHEGRSLSQDLSERIGQIEQLLQKILPLEGPRTERIRTRLMNSLKDFGDRADANRFEQELIYYIERSDFSEEKTRLTQHCKYFMEVLNNGETVKGKMLGFILQEVGREINTLGAKANDAEIQQVVVQMKDELEKAKEQVLNVL